MVVCRGSWAGSCLTDSPGACVRCCVRGAGVTDAQGCSAQLRGRGSSVATVTLSGVLHSHTQSACGSYSSKERKGEKGVEGGLWIQLEKGKGGGVRASQQMQLGEAREARLRPSGTGPPSEA